MAIEHILEKVFKAIEKITGIDLLDKKANKEKEELEAMKKELDEKKLNKTKLLETVDSLEIKLKRQQKLNEELNNKLNELKLKLQH